MEVEKYELFIATRVMKPIVRYSVLSAIDEADPRAPKKAERTKLGPVTSSKTASRSRPVTRSMTRAKTKASSPTSPKSPKKSSPRPSFNSTAQYLRNDDLTSMLRQHMTAEEYHNFVTSVSTIKAPGKTITYRNERDFVGNADALKTLSQIKSEYHKEPAALLAQLVGELMKTDTSVEIHGGDEEGSFTGVVPKPIYNLYAEYNGNKAEILKRINLADPRFALKLYEAAKHHYFHRVSMVGLVRFLIWSGLSLWAKVENHKIDNVRSYSGSVYGYLLANQAVEALDIPVIVKYALTLKPARTADAYIDYEKGLFGMVRNRKTKEIDLVENTYYLSRIGLDYQDDEGTGFEMISFLVRAGLFTPHDVRRTKEFFDEKKQEHRAFIDKLRYCKAGLAITDDIVNAYNTGSGKTFINKVKNIIKGKLKNLETKYRYNCKLISHLIDLIDEYGTLDEFIEVLPTLDDYMPFEGYDDEFILYDADNDDGSSLDEAIETETQSIAELNTIQQVIKNGPSPDAIIRGSDL